MAAADTSLSDNEEFQGFDCEDILEAGKKPHDSAGSSSVLTGFAAGDCPAVH